MISVKHLQQLKQNYEVPVNILNRIKRLIFNTDPHWKPFKWPDGVTRNTICLARKNQSPLVELLGTYINIPSEPVYTMYAVTHEETSRGLITYLHVYGVTNRKITKVRLDRVPETNDFKQFINGTHDKRYIREETDW